MEVAGALPPNKIICCLKAAATALHNRRVRNLGVRGKLTIGQHSPWKVFMAIVTQYSHGLQLRHCTDEQSVFSPEPNMQWWVRVSMRGMLRRTFIALVAQNKLRLGFSHDHRMPC